MDATLIVLLLIVIMLSLGLVGLLVVTCKVPSHLAVVPLDPDDVDLYKDTMLQRGSSVPLTLVGDTADHHHHHQISSPPRNQQLHDVPSHYNINDAALHRDPSKWSAHPMQLAAVAGYNNHNSNQNNYNNNSSWQQQHSSPTAQFEPPPQRSWASSAAKPTNGYGFGYPQYHQQQQQQQTSNINNSNNFYSNYAPAASAYQQQQQQQQGGWSSLQQHR
eukprot:PhM_4_TR13145/c0_g1_i1/m.58388